MIPSHHHDPGSLILDGARPDRVVALVGNPNVGKSTIFNHLTGLGVRTAHYPGKSLEVNVGDTAVGEISLTVMDLPGTYGVTGSAEAQWVNRRALLDVRPDVVVAVVDATNLSRNLVLVMQLLDLGLPTVVAINLSDEATRQGIEVDANALAERLGVPVFHTIATDGRGVAEMMEYVALCASGEVTPPAVSTEYGEAIESAVQPLTAALDSMHVAPPGYSTRTLALQLLDGSEEARDLVGDSSQSLLRVVDAATEALAARSGDHAAHALSRQRHEVASKIAAEVTIVHEGRARRDLVAIATRPLTGIPLLVSVLAGIFLLLFFIGEFLAGIVETVWEAVFSPLIQSAVTALFGESTLSATLLWGLDAGLEASLAIGIPYILTFYFLLAILEDSGYLNAVAFLTDRAMHRMGLHGRSIIPLVAGLGCSVPAVLGTRVLATQRERYIAGTLISMIPCSARTAVILGAVGHYIGIGPALGVFLVSGVVTVIVGITLDKVMKGASTGLVMEIFPFRRPSLRIVGRKAWAQFREFLFVATPLVVLGSMVLGFLYETGLIFEVTGPLEPIVTGWLGLPAIAGVTLAFGLLRKEFALQLLVAVGIATMGAAAGDLTTFMSDVDLFVYALVNTLAMPCISTVAVLGRTLGWWRAASVMAITVSVAVLMGGLFARLLPAVGLLTS